MGGGVNLVNLCFVVVLTLDAVIAVDNVEVVLVVVVVVVVVLLLLLLMLMLLLLLLLANTCN